MNLNMKNSASLAMTLATSLVAAIGTAAGTTVWQSFGKPKVEEMAEKQKKPKQKIGFVID